MLELKLKAEVYKTTYKEGFLYEEKVDFCEKNNINVKKFNAALGFTRYIVINNRLIIRKEEIMNAIEVLFSDKLDKYNFD